MSKTFNFTTKEDFHRWLEKNSLKCSSIWIEFYKDGTNGISYNDALDEALTFGWIDSLIKKVDERIYLRKFSRRNLKSKWSEVNKRKAEELIRTGKMTQIGFETVEEAKRNGEWNKKDEREDLIDVNGLRELIKQCAIDINEFDKLSQSLKEHYSMVYYSAKKEETRSKRLNLIIEYMKTKKRFM